MSRRCWKCGNTYPLTTEYFGHQPSGSLRKVCKACQRKTTKEWKLDNPALAKAQDRKRYRLLKEAPGWHNKEDIALICDELEDSCYYCGEHVGSCFHVDHMMPISRGGSHWPSNITIACETCNLDKHNKTVEEFHTWRRERGMPIAEPFDMKIQG